MNEHTFTETFNTSSALLTEGAIVERLRHEYRIPLDEQIVHAGLIYNEQHRQQLAAIYREYLDIAEARRLPLLLMTPTRRANRERIAASAYKDRHVLKDNAAFLSGLRQSYTTPVYIGGLTGCRGDAYSGQKCFSVEEAFDYHLPTLLDFRESGVEFLFAGIMPELSEATGMAKAMETTGLPYIISFMIGRNGRLMDGTFIHEAIEKIDKQTSRPPICYMANCVHPDILHEALLHPMNDTELVKARFDGIQANAAALSPEELDGCSCLKSSTAAELSDRLLSLLWDFPLKICGGCCGTDASHLGMFADILANRTR